MNLVNDQKDDYRLPLECFSGCVGLKDLKSDIEMLAINKELMPVGQRYIPASWQRFRAALKKKPGYKLHWKQVRVKYYSDKVIRKS